MMGLTQDEFDTLYQRMTPVQVKDGLNRIVKDLSRLNPHAVIEIGIQFGGTLRFWEKSVCAGDLVVGIDISPNLSAISSYFDDAGITQEKNGVWRVSSDRDIRIVAGDSNDNETIENVRSILNGRLVDFLFIDGCHDFVHVKSDFENYAQFVRSGGIVGFDDINDSDPFFDTVLSGKKEKLNSRNAMWWKS